MLHLSKFSDEFRKVTLAFCSFVGDALFASDVKARFVAFLRAALDSCGKAVAYAFFAAALADVAEVSAISAKS